MPIMRLFLLLLLGLSLIPLNACVRQRDGDASEVEVLRSGALNRAGDEDIPNVVYVNVRDMTNRVFHLRSQTEAWLGRKGFTVTDNPSQAGYIVQITVLAAGQAAPESLRGVVDAGYDAPSVLSGTGGTALLADVLLVQRRWMLFFAAGTFFARIPLVFLTAPDTYFMYYLTPFIAGYAVAAAAVLYAVLKRKLKSERITG